MLGAAVAPADATAVGVLARALPRRQVTVLRAESLVNDGNALVVYGLAVGITLGEQHLSLPHVGGLFLPAYGGGAAVGVVHLGHPAPILGSVSNVDGPGPRQPCFSFGPKALSLSAR